MNKIMSMKAIDAHGDGQPGDTSGASWVSPKPNNRQGTQKCVKNRKKGRKPRTVDGVEDRSLAVGGLALCGAVANIEAELRATAGRVSVHLVRLNVGKKKGVAVSSLAGW